MEEQNFDPRFIEMIAKVAHTAICTYRDIYNLRAPFHWDALDKHAKLQRMNAVVFFLKNPDAESTIDSANIDMENDSKMIKAIVDCFVNRVTN